MIRKGKIADFKKLNQPWAWGNKEWERKGQIDYIKGIKECKQEFWVVENEKEIIGELHIYWDNEDKDEANGKDRAYLSALRIHPNYRSQKLGTKLVERALARIKEKGYEEVTIGAYKHEPHIQELYKKWGFTHLIKEGVEETTEEKPHFLLFMKKL
ncbi:GNAT family N-acetyltransferase [Candidatus Peregrinibacteria bacterium]|nr:GNAT family N-acetyltransferase [Candidatus Peregrinibacteria bacterium]